jgi:uncharacterized protein YbjT (DUF2867 family)
MNETILVTGGTGAIGSRVVPLLLGADRPVRILSRHGAVEGRGVDAPGVTHVIGDTFKNDGLDAAFRGAPTVLHLAGGAKGDDVAARHGVPAAQRAGTRHLILISVTGAGEVPIGYMRMKAEAERVVRESGVPFTILRVAQLQSLLLSVMDKMAWLPLALSPRDVRLEPVDGAAVASRLAELALGEPAGRVPDLAGPEVLTFAELVSQYDAGRGRTRPAVRMPLPGAIGRAYRAGANLADGSVWRRGSTWRELVDYARGGFSGSHSSSRVSKI